MKFMFIVKSACAIGPSPKLLEEMHKITKREVEAGRLLDNGGLMPIAEGAQVRIADGRLHVIDGPYAEAKEVIGGYAVFELKDQEEAGASAGQIHQLHQDHHPGRGRTSQDPAIAPPAPRNPA